MGRIEPLPEESNPYLQSSPKVLIRHEAIDMVFAHVPQSRDPPPHYCTDVY